MRITTSLTVEISEELGVYREISRESYEFDGPIAAQCKKGRQQQVQNTAFQQQQAGNYANNANTGFNAANGFYQSELGLTPGGMSSPAAAMFSSDLANIQNTYNGLRQNAFANAGTRGFGNSPSGFMQATQNALNLGEGQAEQQAYNTGLINTQNQRANAAANRGGRNRVLEALCASGHELKRLFGRLETLPTRASPSRGNSTGLAGKGRAGDCWRRKK